MTVNEWDLVCYLEVNNVEFVIAVGLFLWNSFVKHVTLTYRILQ